MKNDVIKTLATLVTIIGVCFTVFFFTDSRYTRTVDFLKLEKRVTVNELEELLQKSLENMYFYRDMLRKHSDDEELKKKLEEAEDEVRALKERVKKLKEEKDAG